MEVKAGLVAGAGPEVASLQSSGASAGGRVSSVEGAGAAASPLTTTIEGKTIEKV